MNKTNIEYAKFVRIELIHAVTRYDRRQSKRPDYNRYALPQYLQRVKEVADDVERGANVRDAILAGFSGRLADVCLKFIGQPAATEEDQECRRYVWCYSPATSAVCVCCGVDLSRSGHAPDCEELPEKH